ncbi:MAG: hypothetical protein HKN33_10315 [Pyrinomonadaceae bacterium]|nr:hypothetical protein [Pyrinomonadaceae bacterium]
MKTLLRILLVFCLMGLVLSCGLFSETDSGTETATETNDSAGSEGSGSENPDDEGKDEKDDESEFTASEEAKPKHQNTKVRFLKGKVSRSYTGSVVKGGSHSYTIGASGGQQLSVDMRSSSSDLKVFDPAGKVLSNAGSPTDFRSTLPSDGTYKVVISNPAKEDKYSVTFKITGEIAKKPDPPQSGGLTKTVKFSKGRSSASYKDAVIRGERNRYVLGAQGGQLMAVSIASLENNAVFQIRGPKGYLRGAGPGTDKRSWSGQLPADGKYTVIVGSTRGNATYTVTFSIR